MYRKSFTDWQAAVNTIAHALNKAGYDGESPESKALELLAGRCEGTADAKEIAQAAVDANTLYQREYLPSHYAQYGEFGDSDHLVLRVDYIAETIAPLLKPSVDARLLGYAVEIKGDETNNEWTVGSFHSLPGPALDDARAAEEEALESGYNYETRITPTYSAAKPSVDVKELTERIEVVTNSRMWGAYDNVTRRTTLSDIITRHLTDSAVKPSVDVGKLAEQVCKIVCNANTIPGHDVAKMSILPIGPVSDAITASLTDSPAEIERLNQIIAENRTKNWNVINHKKEIIAALRAELRSATSTIEELRGELAVKTVALANATQEPEYRIVTTAGAMPEDTIESLRSELDKVKGDKDGAYTERNRLVAFIASIFPSQQCKTNIEGWDPEWHGCVFIETPAGQLSWHFHDGDAELFDHVPYGSPIWDGHSTPEKYVRLRSLIDIRALSETWGEQEANRD